MRDTTLMFRELENEAATCLSEIRTLGAGHSVPLHWHDYFELEILLSGVGRHVCNGVEYEIREGDVWLMSRYDFHAVTMETDSVLLHAALGKGCLLPALEERVATRGCRDRFDAETMDRVREICDTLAQEAANRKPFFEAMQISLVNQLVTILLRRTGQERGVAVPPVIGRALTDLHAHFREPLSMESVARAYGFSPNYFGNLFRSAVGISFREYLNKLRLKHACDLLLSSSLRIQEIADAAGYQSVEYFLYVFKKNLSTSPGAYRRARKRE